ncbi:MAG TPA: hypothetical protein VF305_03415 [Smithellaceae bacterium]
MRLEKIPGISRASIRKVRFVIPALHTPGKHPAGIQRETGCRFKSGMTMI